jgi:hypothetical protein
MRCRLWQRIVEVRKPKASAIVVIVQLLKSHAKKMKVAIVSARAWPGLLNPVSSELLSLALRD